MCDSKQAVYGTEPSNAWWMISICALTCKMFVNIFLLRWHTLIRSFCRFFAMDMYNGRTHFVMRMFLTTACGDHCQLVGTIPCMDFAANAISNHIAK